jgi:hypothetical protein
MADDLPRRWQRSTSWDQIGFYELPDGTRVSRVRIGEDDDPTAPVVLRMEFPPGARLEAHSHETDYCEIIIAGSQLIGRRTYGEGSIRVVKANTAYGPVVAGPDGASVIIMFRDGRWRGRAPHSSAEEEARRDLLATFIDDPHATVSPPDA